MSSDPCRQDRARARALLDWYAACARRLPWRDTCDPYRIWISEVMLQQTQVVTVLPRYAAWFLRFPDVVALAEASEDEVLKAWEGLGYYRRARLLHAAARQVVAEHGGVFPQDFADILNLPGIGRSTAGAIASFCFAGRRPVLDGNVKRVLCRWHALPDAMERQLWALAQQAIDTAPEPGTWNQAMMELGATFCAPANPDCAACPAKRCCASAFRVVAGDHPKTGVAVRDVHWRVHLHVDKQRGLWLTRRPAKGIWAGLWAPPISELSGPPEAEPSHVHLLTHRRLHLYAEHADSPPEGGGQWVPDLGLFALPTGIRRLLEKQRLA